MKLNRKVEFALIALRHMNAKKPGVLTSGKEVSDLYGCSFDVTSRVLQKMAQAGILRSVHGAQGGYQIVRDLKSVSFYELNSLLTGPLGIAKCLHDDGGECEIRSSCNIVSPVQRLNERLRLFYQSLPVADLVEGRAEKTDFLKAGVAHG